MIPDLVEITWRDAAGDASWLDSEDLDLSDVVVTTVGYLVGENEHYLATVNTRSHVDTEVTGFFQIPKACVISRRVIEKGQP